MADRTKQRARPSLYVLSTALIALGAATLSALSAPANAQPSKSPPPCPNSQPQTSNAVDPFLDQNCIPVPPSTSAPAPAQGSMQPPLFSGTTQAQQKRLQ